MIVVSDTSPILNLSAIGYLYLLRDLYAEIALPPAVAAELTYDGLYPARLSNDPGVQRDT